MEKKSKFEKFINTTNLYFSLPFLVIFTIVIFLRDVENINVQIAFSTFLSLIVIIYLCIIVAKIINFFKKKLQKDDLLVWPLIASIVMIILSYILILGNAPDTSNTLFIISVIFFEVYIVYYIVVSILMKDNKKFNISTSMILILFFIGLGFYTIYATTYKMSDKTLFNALIAIFASIIGGGLTLGGVAWTINDNRNKKLQEDKQKHKPYIKLSTNKTFTEVVSCEQIKGVAFDEEIIKKSNKEIGLVYTIKNILLKNCGEKPFITKYFIIDNIKFDLENKIIEKNEDFQFVTTRNCSVNTLKELNNLSLSLWMNWTIITLLSLNLKKNLLTPFLQKVKMKVVLFLNFLLKQL